MIKDINNDKDTAIVFYKGKDLIDFKSKSMPLAATNEYQCHYSALVRIVEFSDGSKQHFVFPLIYYNYKQEVGSAHIDFEMKDVMEKSKEVQEASIPLAKILIAEFNSLTELDYLKKLNIDVLPESLDKGKKVSYKITLFNNIHKHP